MNHFYEKLLLMSKSYYGVYADSKCMKVLFFFLICLLYLFFFLIHLLYLFFLIRLLFIDDANVASESESYRCSFT